MSKYGNRRTVIDGKRFDSIAEARRYQALALMERAGDIANLRCQVRYKLIVNNVSVAVYIADFVYTNAKGKTIVEDVKGVRTAVYRLKRKLMKACLGINVTEIDAKDCYKR